MVEIWEGGETSTYEKPAYTPWLAPGAGMPNIGGGGEEGELIDPYDSVDDSGSLQTPGYDYQTVTRPPLVPWEIGGGAEVPQHMDYHPWNPHVTGEKWSHVEEPDEGGWTPPKIGPWQPPTIGGGLDLTPGAGTGLPDLSIGSWTPPDLSIGDLTKPFDAGVDMMQIMMLMMVMKD